MIQTIVKIALLYFAMVFGAGFLLGTLRVLVLEPLIGDRNAQLSEMPVMLVIIYLCARYVVLKKPKLNSHSGYLFSGIGALIMMLAVEFTLVLGLQELTFATYLASRDSVAFSAYIGSLIVFALMPWLLSSTNKLSNKPSTGI